MLRLTPYTLAVVKAQDRRYLVEIMSLPFIGEDIVGPNQFVKARRVPGNAATLVSIPTHYLEEPGGKYKWVHYAEILAHHPSRWVPEDMLRYDFAEPVNFKLNYVNNERSIMEPQVALEAMQDMSGLIIARCTVDKTPRWTEGRWSSFGFTLRHMRTEKIVRV